MISGLIANSWEHSLVQKFGGFRGHKVFSNMISMPVLSPALHFVMSQ